MTISKQRELDAASQANPTSIRAISDRIEIWHTERLIPSARNARTHSAEQVAELAGSMKAYGFMVPVLVDSDGVIIAGYARVLAARKLSLERVPVLVIKHLTPSEKRAYAIADNKIALNAGWDDELLRTELEDLKGEGVALEILGFSETEFNELLDKLSSVSTPEEDSAPESPGTPVSRIGDAWNLGDHRLICGDATDAASYAAVLGGALADMVFSDPPYNVAYRAPGLGVGITNDDLGSDFGVFLQNACGHMLENTRGAHYLCMSSSELHTLYSAFTKAGGHWSTFVIWGKSTFTLGRADYQRQFEPILYGWREKHPHYWCGARDQGDLWLIDKPQVNDLHPTMKPVALIERAVLNSSRRGESVLDPFGGSGSTLIACEKTGRVAKLIELEARYCDVIIKRWEEFTNREAIHSTAGKTFAQLAAERLGDRPQPTAPIVCEATLGGEGEGDGE
jgi:DNA modification methylase